jgi:hypothetical protein
LIALVLLTFALIVTWFKRRSLAKFAPSVSGDFLTRHLGQRPKRYSYKG